MEIIARKLLQHSTEELINVLTGQFKLVFDNNEVIETNAAETIYTSYIWDIFRVHNNIPLLPQHHVGPAVRKKGFSSGTTINAYTEIYKTIVHQNKDNPDFDISELMRLIYQVNNNLYNHIRSIVGPWQVSLDILDFKTILDHPPIVELKANMEPTPQGVDEVQAQILDILMTDPGLDDCVIAKGMRSDILSKGQVSKCIGPYGYVTDMDSYIFPQPILRGFAEGLRLFYDSIIESRSGAKALKFSKTELADTEYSSRRLQLVTSTVRNLHHGDCGTTEYLLWFVRPPEYDEEGNKLNNGDLPNLLGKYYLDEKTNKLVVITKDSKDIIGKYIKMRSVRYCNHPDPYGICATCFGDLAHGVPPGANLGHLCAVTMSAPLSGSILGTKHNDSISNVGGVTITPEHKPFVLPANGGQSFKLNPQCLKYNPKLIISPKAAERLTHVNDVKNVEDLNITRVTELDTITIEYMTRLPKKGEDLLLVPVDQITIPVSIKRRKGSFSHAFLEFIKEKGWSYDAKRNIVIDLEGWDFSELFILLPLKHHNMADHAYEIAKIIKSSVKDKKNRLYRSNYGDLLVQLFDHVNEKISVNLSALEVILYSTMIVDDRSHDYTLPKASTSAQMGVLETIIDLRSLSASMAYQGHLETLNNPVNYMVEDRPDHPFDPLFVPEQMK